MNTSYKKGFIVPLIVILVAILVGGTVYVAVKNKNKAHVLTDTNVEASSTDSMGDWKTYIDSDYGFSIQYPAGLNLVTSGNKKLNANGLSSLIVSFAQGTASNSVLSIVIEQNGAVNAATYVSQLLELSGIAVAKIKAQQESNVSVGGISASVVQLISTQNNKLTGTHIIFQRGNTRYEMVGTGEYASGPAFEEFYKSFKFTGSADSNQSASYNSSNPNMSGGLDIETGVGHYALPDGKTTAKIGGTYAVMWNPADFGTSTISIHLIDELKNCAPGILGCQNDYMIAYGVRNTGVYKWDTSQKMGGPSTGPNSVTIVPGQYYKIEYCKDYQTDGCEDTDGYFTLTNN